MSFRVAVEGRSLPTPEVIVFGLDSARRIKRVILAAAKAADFPVTVTTEASSRHITHNNEWAAAKSIINKL